MAIEGRELSKQYDPKQVEDRIYDFWLKGGYFHAEPNPDKKPYTVIMPPPNITGQLHMGHALNNTIQDVLVRWRRMQGYETLWMPGTDHASIATEVRIIDTLRQEGITKDDLGREGFLEKAWEWRAQYGGRIVDQLKKLGSSCDWEREAFTMDDARSKSVVEFFVDLYNRDLIYRGERLINWCPDCLTSISDAEVEHEEAAGNFWHIKYPYADGEGYIEIATTRPETLLGDTAVAVHPKDDRYKDLVGRRVILPLMDREIPVVADEYVDMEFGTGAVKITPAHDPNDFEVGERHGLEVINVMNDDASINENGGKYSGLSREDARKAVVKDLEAQGYIIKVEDHAHNIGTCYRCHTVVEPRISLQWFVKMEPLAKPAIKTVEDKDVKFLPERFEKVYFNWMNNIKDWCISRQLWWGHRIPAWYCDECKAVTVDRSAPDVCSKCGSTRLHQDKDVLDTWFSSALWPFSTLGWPDKTPELDYFYPTNVLITAYDIIFFWVARMIFSGIDQMGEDPFQHVMITGLVRDEQGRKMSKSLGNGIDPLEVIDEYGADALRFMLSTSFTPGNDMRYSTERTLGSRNFANKVWNAVRYVLMNIGDDVEPDKLPSELTLEDKWILDIYNNLVGEITHNLENFEIGLAADKAYEFMWDILCDWYIELTKSRIAQGGASAKNAQQILVYLLGGTLRLLHPFMPYITEELWQSMPHNGESIMVADWPKVDEKLFFKEDREQFTIILDAISAIRTGRAEINVPPSKKASVYIETQLPGVFAQGVSFIKRLAFADEVYISDKVELEGAVQVVTSKARILMPMDQLIDKDEERGRLTRELEKIGADIAKFSGKLGNAGFVANAPEAVIKKEKERLRDAEEHKAKIEESLKALG